MATPDPIRFRFGYTRNRVGTHRPVLRICLRHEGRTTTLIPALLDTGSDHCLFDHELAISVGLNPATDGALDQVMGIGGPELIAVAPIEIAVPALGDLTWRIHAQFKSLRGGIPAILGHGGFLQFMRASFSHATDFELGDIRLPTGWPGTGC